MPRVLTGVWNVDEARSDTLEPLFKELGVPWILRKMVLKAKVTHTIEQDDQFYKYTESSSLGTSTKQLAINGPADESKDDKGKATLTTATLEGDTLVVTAQLPDSLGTLIDKRTWERPGHFRQQVILIKKGQEVVNLRRYFVADAGTFPVQDASEASGAAQGAAEASGAAQGAAEVLGAQSSASVASVSPDAAATAAAAAAATAATATATPAASPAASPAATPAFPATATAPSTATPAAAAAAGEGPSTSYSRPVAVGMYAALIAGAAALLSRAGETSGTMLASVASGAMLAAQWFVLSDARQGAAADGGGW